jgi:hypothetical protein
VAALIDLARQNRSTLELALDDSLDDEVQEWSQEEVDAIKQRVIDRHSANHSNC